MTDEDVVAYIRTQYHVEPATECWTWHGEYSDDEDFGIGIGYIPFRGRSYEPLFILKTMQVGSRKMLYPIDGRICSRGNALCVNPDHYVWDKLPVNPPVPAPKSYTPTIYFIQAGDNGPIKIGYTSRDVDSRLSILQVGSPLPLRCIATMHGSIDDEQALHSRFHDARLHGEWFNPVEPILSFIRSTMAQEAR